MKKNYFFFVLVFCFSYIIKSQDLSQQWMFPTIDMALALEESLPTINPILHIMNKEKIYVGDEYWLMNVIENDIFYGYFIQIGGTGANGPIKRDFQNSRKKVRHMSIVPL